MAQTDRFERPVMSTLQRLLKMASKALDGTASPAASGSSKTDWRDLVRTAADKVTGDGRSGGSGAQGDTGVSSARSAPVQDAPTDRAPQASVDAVPDYGTPPGSTSTSVTARAVTAEDRAAIARYDYLLKTAQPEQLEHVHRDAFARLSPAQRAQVEARLTDELPAHERPASSDANDLARAAVRGEAHNPGFLRGLFLKPGARGAAGAAAGLGVGAVAGAGIGAAGGLLAAVAGGAVLSSVATPLLEQASGLGVDFESLEGGFGDLASGAGEYASGFGEQLSEAGSNFELPDLGALGDLFGRD
jgi:hypothetical protein